MARSRSLPIATIVSLQSRAMKKLAVLFIAAVMLAAAKPVVDWSTVAPDIEQRLGNFKPVEMPFTREGYSKREVRLIDELVAAVRDLEDMYWRQNKPAASDIWQARAGSQ